MAGNKLIIMSLKEILNAEVKSKIFTIKLQIKAGFCFDFWNRIYRALVVLELLCRPGLPKDYD